MEKIKPIKVLHTISVKNLTGAAQPLFLLLKELNSKDEVKVSVISPVSKGNLSDKLRNEGFRLYKNIDLYSGKSPLALMSEVYNLAKLIDIKGIDIIHSHLSHDNWVSAFASMLSKRKPPVIRTLHNSKSTVKRSNYRILYNNLNSKLICISDILKAKLIENYSSLASKTLSIHASVDTSRFNKDISSDSFLNKFKLKKEDGIIGMVARFKKGRGHNELISLFKKVLNNFPKAKLLLIGKGEEKKRMEKAVVELNISNSVIFTGYLKDELPKAYRAMTAACVLEEGNDGSMRTILESMACGTPVISLNKGSAAEIISNEKTGFIANNLDELEKHITTLLANQNLALSMGEKASKFIKENYSPPLEAEKHIKVYQEILRNPSVR
ncbi:MAG: glycosyltransferase family 1 protein [Candidatus Schekmanbacteria bacterium]|nr:MAG: glycosyltransferase family 1 protein [Candidatus Schekmanbacteria bacterium]